MNFNVLFLIICAAWVSSELMLVFFVRSKENSTERDERSIVFLNATIYSCVGIAITLGFLGIGHIRGLGWSMPWIGLWTIVIGMITRWTAILTLRKYFTTNVAIRDDHQIITSGVYRFIRHPSYSGSLISFFGLGLVFANWLAMILLTVPITFAFVKRIKIEERALETAFGEKYKTYRHSTWHLFPWIY
jgi:protein-S-isoprenylcysteine O-methyltransferase Ste14